MANIFQRFGNWLAGPVTKPQAKVASLQPTWETTVPQYVTDVRFDVLIKEGYRKNELIYACINAKAKTAMQIALEVTDNEGTPIEQHPLLDLIHRPNDYMNESDFWASVIIYQMTAGRAVYEIEYKNRGLPIALWPLRPDWLKIKLDENRPAIAYYEYTVPGKQPVELKPEQVLDFPLFDPLDRFKTYPPVAVASRVGDVDNAGTDLVFNYFDHGGVPMGYLKTEQVLQEDTIEEIRARFRERYGGHTNWVDPMVLDQGADYMKMGLNLMDELGFESLDARNEARICMVLDVPPIIVGAKVGLEHGTYSNYEQARRSWWEDTILAMYSNFLDVIEYKLLPKYGDVSAVKVDWDVSKVFAFSENENEAWTRATQAWEANAITLNEFCKEVGLEEKGPDGDVYKNEMTTPPQLMEPPAFTTDQPDQLEQESEEESEEVQEDQEEMKALWELLAEIKAVRVEMSKNGHKEADLVGNLPD